MVSQATAGFGVRQCRLAGIAPFRSASAVLIRPAMPAAASRWPILVFTEPTSSVSSIARPAFSAASRLRSSIGSPRAVPVPCAST